MGQLLCCHAPGGAWFRAVAFFLGKFQRHCVSCARKERVPPDQSGRLNVVGAPQIRLLCGKGGSEPSSRRGAFSLLTTCCDTCPAVGCFPISKLGIPSMFETQFASVCFLSKERQLGRRSECASPQRTTTRSRCLDAPPAPAFCPRVSCTRLCWQALGSFVIGHHQLLATVRDGKMGSPHGYRVVCHHRGPR